MPGNGTDRLSAKRQKLEAELKALRDLERSRDQQRALIVGRAVLTHAVEDRNFAAQLMSILDRALIRKRERRMFDLPSGGAAPDGEAARAEEEATKGSAAIP